MCEKMYGTCPAFKTTHVAFINYNYRLFAGQFRYLTGVDAVCTSKPTQPCGQGKCRGGRGKFVLVLMCARACVHKLCVRTCYVRACMRACVHECVRACVRACVQISSYSCIFCTEDVMLINMLSLFDPVCVAGV